MLRAKSLLLILGLMTVVFFVVALIFVPSVAQAIPSSCDPGCPSGQCCTSFLAGTEITVDKNGKTVKIEQLKVGDSVLSFIEKNGKTRINKITFIREGIRDYYFVIRAGEFQVKASANHPFYVGGNYQSWDPAVPRGYKRTDELEIGERIYLLGDDNRSLKEVTIFEIVRINQPTKVYSLTVDNDNNYFAEGFAVHNKWCADCYKTCKSGNVCGYVYGSESDECSSDAQCAPSGCTPGDTQSCSVGVCPGTKTCLSNGTWGSCQKDDSGCPYSCKVCSADNQCVTGSASSTPCTDECDSDPDCVSGPCVGVNCANVCDSWGSPDCNQPCGFYGGIRTRDCPLDPADCCATSKCVDCACGVGVPACAAFQPTCAVVVEPTTSQALSLTNPSFETGNSTGWNPFSNGEVHSKYAHPGSGNYGAGSEGEGGPYEQTINAPQTSLYRVQTWGGASCYRWQECKWGCASTWAHINIDGYENFSISEGSRLANGTIIWNELNRIFPPKGGSLRVSLYSREDVYDPACSYVGMKSAHDDLRITKINSAQTTESDLVSIRIAAQGQGGITQFKVKNSATGQWGGWNTWSPGADGTVLSGTYLAPEVNTVEVNVLDYYGQVASCTNTVTFEQKDPWFQTKGGDVHGNQDVGTTIIPANTYFSLEPQGVASTGRGLGFVGNIEGKMSSPPPGWQVADGTEVISGFGTNQTKYDYQYFENKIESPQSLSEEPTGFELGNLATGFYKVAGGGNLAISSNFSVPATKSILILVPGNLLVKNEISVDVGGFLGFVVAGDIVFEKDLGVNPQANPAATKLVDGVYIANGSIRTLPVGVEPNTNKKFIGKGMFVADADFTGDGFDLRRNIGTNNTTYAAEFFEYRPDLLVNFPSVFGTRRMTWREVAP